MELGLRGQTVMVVGAGAGLGRETALRLVREGCNVVAGSRSADQLRGLEEALPPVQDQQGHLKAVCLPDLTTSQDLEELVSVALGTFGELNGAAGFVGTTPFGAFDELTDEDWIGGFESKFLGAARLVRAVRPTLVAQGGGRIVILSGNSSATPTPELTTSSVVNSALSALAFSLARTYGHQGVCINCVAPGPTATRRYDALVRSLAARNHIPEAQAAREIIRTIADGRIATVEEVAGVVAFLMSAFGGHINGVTLTVDGNQTFIPE